MGKPHSLELRERVVAFVEDGHSYRSAGAHFQVSPRFVNDMVILKREAGSLAPGPQGHGGTSGKLQGHHDRVADCVAGNGDITLFELCAQLARHGVHVHHSSKALLRKAAARRFNALCEAVGDIYDLYTANECLNVFKAAGYEDN